MLAFIFRHNGSPLARSPSPRRRGHQYIHHDIGFSDTVSNVVEMVKETRHPRHGNSHPRYPRGICWMKIFCLSNITSLMCAGCAEPPTLWSPIQISLSASLVIELNCSDYRWARHNQELGRARGFSIYFVVIVRYRYLCLPTHSHKWTISVLIYIPIIISLVFEFGYFHLFPTQPQSQEKTNSIYNIANIKYVNCFAPTSLIITFLLLLLYVRYRFMVSIDKSSPFAVAFSLRWSFVSQ